ncbi:MAG: hypothetical protein AB7F43_01765 [Bacteriovoracia bacterium]
MSVDHDSIQIGEKAITQDSAGSEPCKPTTSVCGCPPHFVRGERKTEVVPIRLTPAERDWLKCVAKNQALSLSEYIRRAALKRRLPPSPAPEINRKTYLELSRIGNNLNQLLRAIHAGEGASLHSSLLYELREALKQLAFEVLGAESR